MLLALDVRVLDRKTIDIQVIADGHDDVDHERAVDADGHAEHAEHEGDLVDVRPQSAGPAGSPADVLLQDGAETIDHTVRERQREHVPVGEVELDEMRGDDLADAVGVDEAGEDGEGHDVLGADQRLQVEVAGDEDPGAEEGQQAEEGPAAAVAAGPARLDHVARALDRVEDEHHHALHHVPLREVEVVDPVGQPEGGRHAEGREHGLLPEGGAAHVPRQRVHED